MQNNYANMANAIRFLSADAIEKSKSNDLYSSFYILFIIPHNLADNTLFEFQHTGFLHILSLYAS